MCRLRVSCSTCLIENNCSGVLIDPVWGIYDYDVLRAMEKVLRAMEKNISQETILSRFYGGGGALI